MTTVTTTSAAHGHVPPAAPPAAAAASQQAPQLSGSTMQAATVRCPPSLYRERYNFADFEITRTYAEGPNWSVLAARCRWSGEQVVLQTYCEVGNVSGCMAAALAAAHSLTHHPVLLPLYAVFRDSVGGMGTALPRSDRVVMVYPGGPDQRPLDALGLLPQASSPSPSSTSSSAVAATSASAAAAGSGGGGGPPVSERGVVRNLLQPLGDLVAVLGASGLRPPYVCGLDVWLGSPEAGAPGQALFMVPLMCHRRGRHPPTAAELCGPVALPYVAPALRARPEAACDQAEQDDKLIRRCLAWSAAALAHTALMGSPPADRSALRRLRKGGTAAQAAATMQQQQAAAGGVIPTLGSPVSHAGGSGGLMAAAGGASPLSLPPLSSPTGGNGGSGGGAGAPALLQPRPSGAGSSMLQALGIQRAGGAVGVGTGPLGTGPAASSSGGGGGGASGGFSPPNTLPRRISSNGVPYVAAAAGGGPSSSDGALLPHAGSGALLPPTGSGMMTPGSAAGYGTPGGSMRQRRTSGGPGSSAASSSHHHGSSGSGGGGSSSSGAPHALGVVPLWLSEEAGDWFRRGLVIDDAGRPPLEELCRHGWMTRHGVARAVSVGHAVKRESLNGLPRELYSMLLDLAPLGVSRPGREEVETMMAEMAAAEGLSAAKPALPWQVHEGPQDLGPLRDMAAAMTAAQAAVAAAAAAGGGDDDDDAAAAAADVIERIEVAEQQGADGSRIVEEVRVVGGNAAGTALGRAARALQAAQRMQAAGRGAAPGGGGGAGTGGGMWVAANPRGTTFDDIARWAKEQREAARGGRARRTTETSPGASGPAAARPSGSGAVPAELPPAAGSSPLKGSAMAAATEAARRGSGNGLGSPTVLPAVAEPKGKTPGVRAKLAGHKPK